MKGVGFRSLPRTLPVLVRLRTFASLVVLSMACAPARADAPARLGADLGLGVSGSLELRSVILATTLLELSAPVTAESAFVAQWGVSLANGDPTDEAWSRTWVAPGNLLVGWSLKLAEGLVLTPSLALPVAQMPNGESRRPAAEFAFAGALGLRGGIDRWLWLPDRLSIVLPATLARWFDPLLVETHVKLGVIIPMIAAPLSMTPQRGRVSGEDDELVIQTQLRLAARVAPGLWVAARFSSIFVLTNDLDKVELALQPELRAMLGPYSHIGVSLTMNLDGPLGPFWEPGRFWGVVIHGSTPL